MVQTPGTSEGEDEAQSPETQQACGGEQVNRSWLHFWRCKASGYRRQRAGN